MDQTYELAKHGPAGTIV